VDRSACLGSRFLDRIPSPSSCCVCDIWSLLFGWFIDPFIYSLYKDTLTKEYFVGCVRINIYDHISKCDIVSGTPVFQLNIVEL